MIAIRPIPVVFGLMLMIAALPAQAQNLVVVASGAPTLTPGQVVKANAPLDIPAGASVTLVSESGKTVTLTGPHSGPAGIGGGGGGGKASLVSSLSKLLEESGRETASLGTMRAAGRREPPDDPWVMDIGQSGDQCAAAAGAVIFWRAVENKARILSLKNLNDRSRALADWPAGASRLEWPKEVKLADGARYLLRLKGSRATRKITLHLVPGDLPTDAHKAAWMAEKGCARQAMRLLARLR
ncbi:MAG: hypothetical protein ACE5GT_10345 [Rhodospirillales bacterium]